MYSGFLVMAYGSKIKVGAIAASCDADIDNFFANSASYFFLAECQLLQ
jgi:hypothetical protein